MANQKLTSKTALEEQAGSGDLLMVVDVNDTTGSSSGTSKKMDFKYLMQTDKISVSNAEAQALNSTAKTLVGALSGYMITVYHVTILCTHNSPNETANKYLYLGYDSSDSVATWQAARAFMEDATTNNSYCMSASYSASGTCRAALLNKPFVMWSSGAFNGGWTADVYVTYAYTKVL